MAIPGAPTTLRIEPTDDVVSVILGRPEVHDAFDDVMIRCPHPVVARVQGAAIGGGAGLVATVDIAAFLSKSKPPWAEPR